MTAFIFSRTMVVPVWLLTFALAVMLAPSGIDENRFLIVGSGLVAVAVLLLSKSLFHPASDGLTIDVAPPVVPEAPKRLPRQHWTSRW